MSATVPWATAVVISIWFDPADEGKLRHRVSYENVPA